jgi:hypothetical protein
MKAEITKVGVVIEKPVGEPPFSATILETIVSNSSDFASHVHACVLRLTHNEQTYVGHPEEVRRKRVTDERGGVQDYYPEDALYRKVGIGAKAITRNDGAVAGILIFGFHNVAHDVVDAVGRQLELTCQDIQNTPFIATFTARGKESIGSSYTPGLRPPTKPPQEPAPTMP